MSREHGPPPGRSYRFPSGVTLHLVAGREIATHFDAEYGELRCDEGGPIDIEVHAVDYPATIQVLRRAGTEVSELKGRHKTVTWRVAVWGLDDATTHVAFRGAGQMAVSFLQTFYVEPLLRLKVLQKGYALVHACAVMRGRKVIIFAGGSGVGKTTIALRQIARGKGVLGDNYVVISPSGEASTVHRRMRLYSDLSRSNPAVYRSLPGRHRLRLRAHGVIKTFSRGFANLPHRLSVRELAPAAADAAAGGGPLDSVYVLTRGSGSELVGPRPLDLDEVVRRVQEYNIAEAVYVRRLLATYLAKHPDSAFCTLDAVETSVLHSAFHGLPAFEIQVPRVDEPAALADRIACIAGIE